MSKRIEDWDPETMELATSVREYDHYSLTAVKPASEGSYSNDSAVTLHLYVDARTGVVTTDVLAYERSLQ